MKKKKHISFIRCEWLIAVTVITLMPVIQGHGGCRTFEYLKCISNKAFTGHVIKSVKVSAPGLDKCQSQCFRESRCVSYNMGPVNGHVRTCELSSSDHWTFPALLKDTEGHEYCPIMNQCSSKPCPANKPFCYPDFSWDNFTCVDGQWGQWSPWRCVCPPQRIRLCVTATNQTAKECGPGNALEYDKCDSPQQKFNCTLFDFESGNLDGWTLTGTAFNNQPTYGDNLKHRSSDSTLNLKGDWSIATYENRPSPSDPPGMKQGDEPKGSATSPPFAITGSKLKFMIAGSTDTNLVRLELLIGGNVVLKAASAILSDSMSEREFDVTAFKNQIARVRIVDDASAGWGIISVDHIYLDE